LSHIYNPFHESRSAYTVQSQATELHVYSLEAGWRRPVAEDVEKFVLEVTKPAAGQPFPEEEGPWLASVGEGRLLQDEDVHKGSLLQSAADRISNLYIRRTRREHFIIS
jgi:hypothetical protein